MSGLQIILIVVIVSLTLLLLIVGIQVIVIINEIRKVVRKVNAMLEGKNSIEDVVTRERVQNVLQFVRSKLPFKR